MSAIWRLAIWVFMQFSFAFSCSRPFFFTFGPLVA